MTRSLPVSYPGVYLVESKGGTRAIPGVASDVTAFLGRAWMGPVNEAVELFEWDDYERVFGGIHPRYPLSFSVKDFFNNGGRHAVVVRLIAQPPRVEAAPTEEITPVGCGALSFSPAIALAGEEVELVGLPRALPLEEVRVTTAAGDALTLRRKADGGAGVTVPTDAAPGSLPLTVAIARWSVSCAKSIGVMPPNAFSAGVPRPGEGLQGGIYLLPSTTQVLPDLSTLTPASSLRMTVLDTQARGFTGFPEVPGRPGPLREWFGIMAVGALRVREAGLYRFKALSDDGIRVWLGGELLFEDADIHAPRDSEVGVRWLEPGDHPLRLDYFQGPGGVTLRFFWLPPGAAEWEIMPPEALRLSGAVRRT
ncbi:MAG: hypothetical protein H6741_31825 [Alphaproteobacteria bacterium]|nr:hypothetical protein [Alphaproteobacteria bacterium]